MRLISCYIENFGNLQKFSYEFNKGLNIILEENGWGKSTLAAFLKAMFYGLERTTKRSLDENERKKYEPWNGGVYGGNLVFETEGNRYRIERFFGIKDKEDTFSLYDMETGLECNVYSEHVGEELFGIDRTAFEQSIFLKQGMYAVSMTDSVTTKMSGLMASGDDIDCYEKACLRIDSEMKLYKKIGNKGRIPELAEEISAINRKLAEGKQIQASLADWETKKKLSMQEQEDLLRQKGSLKNLIRRAAELTGLKEKRKYYDTLAAEKMQLEQTVRTLDTYFQSGVPEEEELEMYRNKLFLYNRTVEDTVPEVHSYRYPDVADVLKENPITEEELDACEKKWKEIGEKEALLEEKKIHVEALEIWEESRVDLLKEMVQRAKVKQYLCLGLTIVTFIAAFVLYFMNVTIPCAVCALLGGVFLILFVVFLVKYNALKNTPPYEDKELRQEKKECDELATSIKNIRNAVRMYLRAHGDIEDNEVVGYINKIRITLLEIKAENEQYMRQQMQKEKECREKESLREEIISFLRRFYPEVNEIEENLLKEIIRKRNEYINVSKQFEIKCEQLDQAEKVEDISDEELLSMEKLQLDEKNLEKEIATNESCLRQIERTLTQYKEILEECEKLEMEKHDLDELLVVYTDKYKLLERTLKYLKNAQTEFSSRYLKKMNDGFSKYAKLFREDAFDGAALDVKLAVKSDEGGVKRDMGYYSMGLRETMELCTRFSLIDALFEKEQPFVILDDPFVNMDEKSLQGAKEVLAQIAKQYQLIYFTCHPSRQ